MSRDPLDPTGVGTVAELSAALKGVYLTSGLSYSRLDRAARTLPGTRRLASSTVSDMFNGRLPSRETLLTFLTVCQVSPDEQRAWLRAWQRVRSGGERRPPGGVRVRDVSPRELGVHAAIRHRDSNDDLPLYISRDFDAALHAAVSEGAEQGGFLILVGSSSVGKTRSAYEAVLAYVPDWWLVQPATRVDLATLSGTSCPYTVVWVDELQRYLGRDRPVINEVRALCRAGAIVIGTLWPDEYLTRTARAETDEHETDSCDRELLRMAQVIDVPAALSRDELERARSLSYADGRIRTAMSMSDAGPIQVLAAGPELVRWWEQSPNPYGRAVITAVVDARRLGVRSPSSRAFIEDAAPGYLTPQLRAAAPSDWFHTALAYALTPLHGAASTLHPVPPDDGAPGAVAGYVVADYLLQHARRTRRTAVPPVEWWQACARHCDDEDVRRLAEAAQARARYQCVDLLYRPRADRGDPEAANALAELLARQGRTDEAIAVLRPVAGRVPYAARQLTELLLATGRTDEAVSLLWPPDDRRWDHADALVTLLTDLGRHNDAVALLRARPDAESAERLANVLVRLGRLNEAIAALRKHPDAPWLKSRLATLLEQTGEVDEAIALLGTCTEYESIARQLVDLLVQHDRIDELRKRSDQGNDYATWQLADVLAEQSRASELTALIEAQHHNPLFTLAVGGWLADVLADQDALHELRRRADAGDVSAGYRLAERLIERDCLDEVRTRAKAGDWPATLRLAQHLERLDRPDEAVKVLRAWHDPADSASELSRLLAGQGRLDESIEAARVAAMNGDLSSVIEFDRLLGEHNHLAELRTRAEEGEDSAAWTLASKLRELDRFDEALDVLALREDDHAARWRRAQWLYEQGRVDDLRALARTGDEEAECRLVDHLAEHKLTRELHLLCETGTTTARYRLIDLHAERGDLDELREWADRGEHTAADHLLRLLAERDDLDGLRAEVDAGTADALDRLVTQLASRGLLDCHGATRLHAFGLTPSGETAARPVQPT